MKADSAMLRRSGVLVAATFGLLCFNAAHADAMLVSDTGEIRGTTTNTVSYSFNVSGPGSVSVSLVDVGFNSALSNLSLTLAGSKPLGQLTGAGAETFDISGAGTYFAYVTGQATSPSSGLHLNLGLYSLNISFSPLAAVPLPPGFALMASALACMALLLRGRFKRNA